MLSVIYFNNDKFCDKYIKIYPVFLYVKSKFVANAMELYRKMM